MSKECGLCREYGHDCRCDKAKKHQFIIDNRRANITNKLELMFKIAELKEELNKEKINEGLSERIV